MLKINKKNYLDTERNLLLKKEEKFIAQKSDIKPSALQKKLEDVVPDGLQETLNKAFRKAFQIIFDKGTPWIEKTYAKEDKQIQYAVNDYAAKMQYNKKTAKAFSKEAKNASQKNLLLSGLEGVGLGALGIGIPDIPLFVAMIFKSIYEIAISYGFSYEEEREQIFILKMIETSMQYGNAFQEHNAAINRWIERDQPFSENKEEMIAAAADALSKELLYFKFLQGIPVVGMVGGISDTVYLKKITDYAHLKYKRRFLKKNIGTV